MQLGLVTYMWGAEWDLPTVIKNCQATGFAGVELRSGHKHGVEPSLNGDYPWQPLFDLLNAAGFDGWTLLEEGAPTADPLRVMKYYRLLWEKMTQPNRAG